MKFKVKHLLSVLLVLVTVMSSFVGVVAQDGDTVAVQTYSGSQLKQAIARLTGLLAENYYYGVTDEDLLYRALCSAIDNGSFDYDMAVESMMKLLKDGYSEFYSAERFQQMYTSIAGEFYGIGVSIMLSGDHVVVVSVFPDSPAEDAGILPYDLIVSVDGTDISGMSTADVANLIKREKGKKVDIGIVRNGVNMTISCFCDEVNQNPITYEIMEDNIGYIYISTFTMNLDEFITPALKEFEEKGITDIILDIRNNGGGELNAAISLAQHFIPEGTIAKLKYKNEIYNQDLTVQNAMTKSPYNLVLLVNENSASASELFAGAVKGRAAGTIIGTTTYGKGSMQSIYTLMTGSAIKYTIAEFHTPNDERIHTVGIEPDYKVENNRQAVDEAAFEKIAFNHAGSIEEGNNILAVEQRLEALGCLKEEADTVYTDETRDAIMYFQMLKNLDITGIPDAYTLVALNDIIYDFEIVTDEQIKAAVQYIKTGNIDEYITVEEAVE